MKKRSPNKPRPHNTESGERAQKVLAAAGLGSRREIDRLLQEGKVRINGKQAKPGDRICATDQVILDGRRVSLQHAKQQQNKVIVYNKPEGELVTRNDPQGRPTIFQRLPALHQARWISVGRLDINSSGVLLLTTNGELANKLMHPSSNVEREYLVRIQG